MSLQDYNQHKRQVRIQAISLQDSEALQSIEHRKSKIHISLNKKVVFSDLLEEVTLTKEHHKSI